MSFVHVCFKLVCQARTSWKASKSCGRASWHLEVSVVSMSAAVQAQASAPSLPIMPKWALIVGPHAHWVKGLFRYLREAGCTIIGNGSVSLLECYKDAS
eukprot:1151237-Pelagomonas_calceolata.AAC.1